MSTRKSTASKPDLAKFVDRYVEACGIVSVEDLLVLCATALPEEEVSYERMAQAAASLVGGWSRPRGTWRFEGVEYALAYSLSDSGTLEALFYDTRHEGREYDEAGQREVLEETLDRRVELARLHEHFPVKPVDDWDFPWPWRDCARDTPQVQALVDCVVKVLARGIGLEMAQIRRSQVGAHVEQLAGLIMTMDDGMEDELRGFASNLEEFVHAISPLVCNLEADGTSEEVLAAVLGVYRTSSLWGLNGWSIQEVHEGKVVPLEPREVYV